MINDRKICYDILIEYEKTGAYLNLLLKDKLPFDNEHNGFITEIVYGVVRYKRYLDYKIEKYSSVKLKKISLPVLIILRMGFYQLYFMDSVPDFAVIDESVKLCGKAAYKSKGFVNALMRNGSKDKAEEKNISWEIKYSFSDEMLATIKKQYREKTENILKYLNEKKPTVARINKLKTTKEGFLSLLKEESYTKKGNYLLLNGGVDKKLYNEGLYTVQSISSQMSVEALSPKENEVVFDICCAPGGKTAYICELMKNTGKVFAFELYEHRAELTKKNLERLGVLNAEVYASDSTVLKREYIEKADKVLCDVPCSGWGVIGGKPDIKWREENINELIGIQKKILNNSAKYLKKGGVLVYSTCTINKDENENLVNEFLINNEEFELCPFVVESDTEKLEADGYLQILPDETKPGFFIAKICRKGI